MQASVSPGAERFVVVVGVDYSGLSDLALERALEAAAGRAGVEIHPVNVVRTYGPGVVLDDSALPGAGTVSLSEARDQLTAHVESRVADFLRREGKRSGSYPIERVVCHVRLDAPAAEIAALAEQLDADLVIVGTHGRRGLSRVLLGSVAEGVVRASPCPVLVVRPKSSAVHQQEMLTDRARAR